MSDAIARRGHAAAALLADAGWLALQDRIVMGLCHDVNGRIASLQAAQQLAEMGERPPISVGTEMERLEAVTQRLAFLVGYVDGAAEPLEPARLVEQAIDVQARIKDTRDHTVELVTEEGLPPVLVNEGRYLRALLILVDWAARATSAPEVPLVLGVVDEGAEVAFEAEAEPPAEYDLESLDRLLGLDGGRVTRKGTTVSLWVPSLTKARRDGR